jgi:hypothetical protein
MLAVGNCRVCELAISLYLLVVMALEAVTRLRRLIACCRELQSVGISDNAVATCTYDLRVFNKCS